MDNDADEFNEIKVVEVTYGNDNGFFEVVSKGQNDFEIQFTAAVSVLFYLKFAWDNIWVDSSSKTIIQVVAMGPASLQGTDIQQTTFFLRRSL